MIRDSIRPPHHDLTTIITGWDDLRLLVSTSSSGSTWPPARAAYVDQLDAQDAREVAATHAQQLVTTTHADGRVSYACAQCDYTGEDRSHTPRADRDPAQLGDRPVPLNLSALDTIRAIEEALLAVADQVAAVVQRPAMSHAPTTVYRPGTPDAPDWTPDTGWGRSDVARRNALADQDAADPRRWTYSGTRTAPAAAAWLLARLMSDPGPFRPLPDAQRALIGKVAAGAADRMERVLGIQRTTHPMDRPCPWCAGTLTMTSGGDDLPLVRCDTGESCTAPVPLTAGRREWRGPIELAALQAALSAAGRRAWERDRKRAQRAAA